jgi:serine/threonine protein kinase
MYPLKTDLIIQIMIKICIIVKEIHKLGIIHRDIKLENFIIKYSYYPLKNNSDFEINIIDWGASCFQSKCPNNKYGTSKWSSSPEMFIDKPIYDYKNDIWALGIMLFIMCAHDFPFDVLDFRVAMIINYEINYSKIKQEHLYFISLIKKILCPYEHRISIDEILLYFLP